MVSSDQQETYVIIKFCCHLGYFPKKTFEMLQQSCTGNKISKLKYLSGIKCSMKKGARLMMIREEVKVFRGYNISDIIQRNDIDYSDRQMTICDICNVTGHSCGTVQHVLTKNWTWGRLVWDGYLSYSLMIRGGTRSLHLENSYIAIIVRLVPISWIILWPLMRHGYICMILKPKAVTTGLGFKLQDHPSLFIGPCTNRFSGFPFVKSALKGYTGLIHFWNCPTLCTG